MQNATVAMESIHADDDFNSRKHSGLEESKIKSLAAEIKRDGLMSPLIVSIRPKGGYSLVAGFRRFKALQVLEWPTVDVRVAENAGEEGEAKVLNVVENVARENLSSYEQALACVELRDKYKFSGAQIANRLAGGLSKSYVNNLLRALTNIKVKDVIDAWSNPDHPAHEMITTDFLNEISVDGLEKDTQLDMWEKRLGKEEEPEEGESTGDEKAKKSKKPSEKILLEALEAVKQSDADITWKEGAIAAFRFALGKVKSITTDGQSIYSPAAAKAAREEAKEEERAAKKAAKADAEMSAME